MKCQRCGHPMKFGEEKCRKCGTKIKKTEEYLKMEEERAKNAKKESDSYGCFRGNFNVCSCIRNVYAICQINEIIKL